MSDPHTPTSPGAAAPLVFVTVGTDHHRFDRLMRWIDECIRAGRLPEVRWVIQRGTSEPTRAAESVEYLGAPEMDSFLREATVVVAHGGAATMLECIRAGVVPLVVPRRKALGEHVDDHQVAFAKRMAAEGACDLVDGPDQLTAALGDALRDPASRRTAPREPVRAEVVQGIGRLVEELVEAKRRRRPAAPPEARPLRVLFVGGWGRSGSTLLGRILGQVPGLVLAGEVREVWARVAEDRPCGCGVGIRACPFWRAVGRRAFGGWDRVPLDRLVQLRSTLDRPWSTPRLLLFAGRSRGVREYADALAKLYRAIAEESGATVVVDVSKIATHALLARRVPGVDLRVVHLVRDSRGVAYSWQKHMIWPDERGGRAMRRFGALPASFRYLFYNSQTQVLRRLGHPYLLVRYEDLVADPGTELRRILRSTVPELDRPQLPISDGVVHLGVDHTADGNPMRFKTGAMPLRLDEEWRRRLGRKDRLVVSALTAPLLRRYAYPVRPARPRGILGRR